MIGPADPGSSMEKLDELLEVLFWMEGEGFDQDATVEGLARFLTYPEPLVAKLLDRLVERGDVAEIDDGPTRYTLTEVGKREGGRRFQESFAPLLSQGHGECNDPNCDCITEGPAACTHYDHAPQGG